MAMFRQWRNPVQQRARMNSHPSEQLKATLNLIPANTWYATPAGGLTFVNKRNADYGGRPNGPPPPLGSEKGAGWGFHIFLVPPAGPEGTRRGWATLFEDGSGGRGDVSRAQRDRRIPLVSQPRRAFPGGRRNAARLDRHQLRHRRTQASRVLPCRGTAACPHGQLGVQRSGL